MLFITFLFYNYYMQEIKQYVIRKKQKLKEEISSFSKTLTLGIISLNNDPASKSYIKGKIKDSLELGVKVKFLKLKESTSEERLFSFIDKWNNDENIDGFIVQLPLPNGINEEEVKRRISPKKDIDGFNPLSKFIPATPKGIITYLKDMNYEFNGKNAVILGRSNIVGKPLALELLSLNMNVTILHSKTSEEDRIFFIEHADLICVAIGKPMYLDERYNYKKSAIIIDVGINRVDGKLVGDVKPNLSVAFQSPVPGGVGLLTRLSLLLNLMEVE